MELFSFIFIIPPLPLNKELLKKYINSNKVVVVIVSGQLNDVDHNFFFNNETEIQSSSSSNRTLLSIGENVEPAKSNQLLLARAAAVDPLRRCDLTFYDADFYFTSPEYPRPYSNNLDCVMTVKRARDVCRLRLHFHVFQVQSSEGCLSDFLRIGDGGGGDDDTLCGTFPPSETTREYSFTGSDLKLRFHSDAFETAPGFFVRARQVPCGRDVDGGGSYSKVAGRCDVLVDRPQFDISNRNWPLDTPLDCTFTIRKLDRDVCNLQLIFVALHLNCQFEYLDIGQRRFCSQPKEQFQVVDFLGVEFVIRFHSDLTDRNSRLSIRVIQRRCPRIKPSTAPEVATPPPPLLPPPSPLQPDPVPSEASTLCRLNPYDGGTTTSDGNFLLRSPSYATNTDCVYVVRKNSPDVCSLSVLVREFRLESTPNCDSSFLAVGNEKLCANLPRGSVRVFEFPNDEIPIRFFSDSFRVGSGFAVSVSQRTCKGSTPVSPPLPIVPIPGSGFNCDAIFTTVSFVFWSTSVPSSSVCTITVFRAASDICSLQLYFQVFDFGLVRPSCSRSFFDVKGDRLCDRSVQGTTRTYSFDGPNIEIRYYSNFGTLKFRIAALQRRCRIQPRPAPPPPSPSPFPIDVCDRGVGIPSVVVKDRRFRLRHLVVRSSYGSPSVVDCVYVVRKSSLRVCRLRIDFVYFNFDDSDRCSNEFLEINGIRFCGNELGGTKKSFDFVGSELYIRFRIGYGKKKSVDPLFYGRPRGGFVLDGDQLECYVPSLSQPKPPPPQSSCNCCCCNRTFSSSEEVSLSVRFDSSSKSFSSLPSYCEVTIYKYRSDVCNIEVEFVSSSLSSSFQLPNTKSSAKDVFFCGDHFLEIGGRRHCLGNITPGTIERYDFPNEVFRFAYGSRGGQFFGNSGFTIRIRQIPCLVLPVNLIQRTDPYSAPLLETESSEPSPPFGGCDVVYDKTSFYWSSPSFPDRYAANVDCALTVRKTNPNVCRLFVAFRYFDVEYSQNCSKDYLQISSAERFCGFSSTPFQRFFTFRDDSTVLNFHSDESGSKLGFSVYVEQEPCDESPRLNTISTV